MEFVTVEIQNPLFFTEVKPLYDFFHEGISFSLLIPPAIASNSVSLDPN